MQQSAIQQLLEAGRSLFLSDERMCLVHHGDTDSAVLVLLKPFHGDNQLQGIANFTQRLQKELTVTRGLLLLLSPTFVHEHVCVPAGSV